MKCAPKRRLWRSSATVPVAGVAPMNTRQSFHIRGFSMFSDAPVRKHFVVMVEQLGPWEPR